MLLDQLAETITLNRLRRWIQLKAFRLIAIEIIQAERGNFPIDRSTKSPVDLSFIESLATMLRERELINILKRPISSVWQILLSRIIRSSTPIALSIT